MNFKSSSKKLAQYLIQFLVFLLPFQVRDLVYQLPLMTGKFSPFGAFYLNIQDILFAVLLIFLASLWQQKKLNFKFNFQSKSFLFLMLAYLLAVIHVAIFNPSIFQLMLLLRIVEFFLLFLAIRSDLIDFDKLKVAFLLSMLLQVLIAVFQFIFQESLGLYLLGESHLSPEITGLAKVDFGDHKLIRSYGLLPHPNILALYLGLAFYLAMSFWSRQKILVSLYLVWIAVGIYFSGSRGVIIALILSLIVTLILKYFKEPELSKKNIKYKKIYFLIATILISIYFSFIAGFDLLKQRFTFSDYHTITERVEQIQVAIAIMRDEPFGIGLFHFLDYMPVYINRSLAPWQFQPVHNVFLLSSTELSLVFAVLLLLAFVSAFIKLIQKGHYLHFSCLLFIFILANLDHYFYDIYSAQLALVLALAYSSELYIFKK